MVFLQKGMWVHGRVNAYIGMVLQSDGSNSNQMVLMCNQMVKISLTKTNSKNQNPRQIQVQKSKSKLLPRWLNNILVIVCTMFSTLLTLVVLLLLAKHFKMKSLIASLVIATLPPPSVATTMVPSTGQFDLLGL